jgi:hypothetical protein
MPRRLLVIPLLLSAIPCAAAVSYRSWQAGSAGGFVCDGGDLERALPGLPASCALALQEPGELSVESTAPAGTLPLDAPSTPIRALLARSELSSEGEAPLTPRARAFEYSDGYRLRAKVHKYASVAMLPLFVAQVVVGQKLYNGNGSDSLRGAHSALAAGTGVLFGVNTITGAWNLYEGRKDPSRRTKRVLHGVLMLVADAGFAATGALAPEHEREAGVERGGVSRSTHRTIALSAMGVATVSLLIMAIGH